jgi:hypothetical protein
MAASGPLFGHSEHRPIRPRLREADPLSITLGEHAPTL